MTAKKKAATKKRVKQTASKPAVCKPAKPKISLGDMQDLEFASLFIGGSDDIRGSATRIYRYMHPNAKWNTCQVEGSKTLKKAIVQKFLEAQIEIVQKETGITAEWVLRESVKMYDQAVARLPVVEEVTVENEKTGEIKVTRVERLVTNPLAALKALELIGKNIVVKAFQENIAVDHTHRLVEMLNARGKAVEEAAVRRKLKLVSSDRPDELLGV